MSRDLKMLNSFIKELTQDRKVLENQRIFLDEKGNRKLYKDLNVVELRANSELFDQINAINMQIMEKKAKIECIEIDKKSLAKEVTIYKDYESNTVYTKYETKSFIIIKEYSAYSLDNDLDWTVRKKNKQEMKELKELLSEMPSFYTNTIKLKGVR